MHQSGRTLLGQLSRLKPLARAARRLVRPFQAKLLVACAAGVVIGLTASCAGPWLGVAAAWVSGCFTTLAVQGRATLRRALPLESSH